MEMTFEEANYIPNKKQFLTFKQLMRSNAQFWKDFLLCMEVYIYGEEEHKKISFAKKIAFKKILIELIESQNVLVIDDWVIIPLQKVFKRNHVRSWDEFFIRATTNNNRNTDYISVNSKRKINEEFYSKTYFLTDEDKEILGI